MEKVCQVVENYGADRNSADRPEQQARKSRNSSEDWDRSRAAAPAALPPLRGARPRRWVVRNSTAAVRQARKRAPPPRRCKRGAINRHSARRPHQKRLTAQGRRATGLQNLKFSAIRRRSEIGAPAESAGATKIRRARPAELQKIEILYNCPAPLRAAPASLLACAVKTLSVVPRKHVRAAC